ncbi:MAG: DNA alkylation repair protein [Leptolyngbyaceae cyanobacterium]
MIAKQISETLKKLGNSAIAEHSKRFFKTGKGEYGGGDQFLGIRVPALREQVEHYQLTSLPEVKKLLMSPFHSVYE